MIYDRCVAYNARTLIVSFYTKSRSCGDYWHINLYNGHSYFTNYYEFLQFVTQFMDKHETSRNTYR